MGVVEVYPKSGRKKLSKAKKAHLQLGNYCLCPAGSQLLDGLAEVKIPMMIMARDFGDDGISYLIEVRPRCFTPTRSFCFFSPTTSTWYKEECPNDHLDSIKIIINDTCLASLLTLLK